VKVDLGFSDLKCIDTILDYAHKIFHSIYTHTHTHINTRHTTHTICTRTAWKSTYRAVVVQNRNGMR